MIQVIKIGKAPTLQMQNVARYTHKYIHIDTEGVLDSEKESYEMNRCGHVSFLN